MKGLSLKLKGRLFSAFVRSVLLYNSEVWVIGKREMKHLEGLGHWQKGDEGFRREGRVPHEEGGGREGEKRERGRENVISS